MCYSKCANKRQIYSFFAITLDIALNSSVFSFLLCFRPNPSKIQLISYCFQLYRNIICRTKRQEVMKSSCYLLDSFERFFRAPIIRELRPHNTLYLELKVCIHSILIHPMLFILIFILFSIVIKFIPPLAFQMDHLFCHCPTSKPFQYHI